MYSFEGDFRQKPMQALGGSRKTEPKEVLLQRTQDERRKREELKRRQHSAVIIQSTFRSSRVRQHTKQQVREEFDSVAVKRQKAPLRVADGNSELTTELTTLTRQLLFFYNRKTDVQRLTWLCQQLVLNHSKMAALVCSTASVRHQLKRLLVVCCRFIEVTSDNIAMQLRMLEVYTDVAVYTSTVDATSAGNVLQTIVEHLIKNGFYRCLRALIESRLPSSVEHQESRTAAPTAMADTVMTLVMRPLVFVTDASCPAVSFRDEVLQRLSSSLFCVPYSEPVRNFLIPTLSQDARFPFVALLYSLVPGSQRTDGTGTSRSMLESVEGDWSLTVEPSIWLLHSMLFLAESYLESLSDVDMRTFLIVLHKLVPHLNVSRASSSTGLEDSESEDDVMETDGQSDIAEICQQCVEMLNSTVMVRRMVGLTGLKTRRPDQAVIAATAAVCHALMFHKKLAIHKTRLLYSLAFNPTLLSNLWEACKTVTTKSVTGMQTPLLPFLIRGLQMAQHEFDCIVPLVSVFCSLFSHLLTLMHDVEFFGDKQTKERSTMPFRLFELAQMALTLRDVCLGLIDLAHPDTKPIITSRRSDALNAATAGRVDVSQQLGQLAYVFKTVAGLVKQLYQRNGRRSFCAPDHWLSNRPIFQVTKPSAVYNPQAVAFVKRPFGELSILNPNRPVDEDAPRLSSTEVRKLITLTELPFVVPFEDRVTVFHQLVKNDKAEHQGPATGFGLGPSIGITVRRNYLYEDAFEKLSPENEPNMKVRMQVRLMNFAGLDEAGIDGGGIFREFMSELIKTAFDPNRGFFCSTSDKLLYPNPQARLLVDTFTAHYFFLGRILGKVLYENLLTELPFASFFLSKLLSPHKGDVDIHHLASLDPEMYRNLMFLMDYDGDVSELGLDFTVVNNDFGETQVEELKHGGRDTLVNNSNRIEYIHLMADYRLNKQIRLHCNAFRSGLNDIVNIDWLRMFDHNELQTLISGAQVPIDIDDLRQNTNYSGGYTPEHPVIQMLWRVVEGFDDTQRRQLLKFVTSCSRPPLLGFKNLYPSFCVHHAGSEADRLPTASTCMNLLKLPEFQDEETLRQKLLYAIEAGAGFELS